MTCEVFMNRVWQLFLWEHGNISQTWEWVFEATAGQMRFEFKDDYYLVVYFGTTLNHPVGTSKSGPDSDAEAVMNSRSNVRGVKRLR